MANPHLCLSHLLSPERVVLNAAPGGRLEAIDALLSLHAGSGVLSDAAQYKVDVFLREEEGSTALGRGLAIPHAKSAGVLRPALCAMTVPNGVDWDSPDRRYARLLFMIAAPPEGGDLHLQILARLMRVLIHGNLQERLMASATPQDFLAAVAEEEHLVFPTNEHGGAAPW